MDKSEKIKVLDLLQDTFAFEKVRNVKLENKLRVLKELEEAEVKLTAIRKKLRMLIDDYGELHVDLNGKIFKISPMIGKTGHPDTKDDVVIWEVHITCKRITPEG